MVNVPVPLVVVQLDRYTEPMTTREVPALAPAMPPRVSKGDAMTTHLDIWEAELDALIPTAWETWCAQAERLAGHSLDGDQATDGYSLDYAFDAFEAGASPATYVATIR